MNNRVHISSNSSRAILLEFVDILNSQLLLKSFHAFGFVKIGVPSRIASLTGLHFVTCSAFPQLQRSLIGVHCSVFNRSYVVYNQQGYSKHYYAGAERVSSRIGGGTLYGLQHPINDTVTPITDEYGYPEMSSQLWGMLQRSFTECLDLQTEYGIHNVTSPNIKVTYAKNYSERK